MSAEIRLAELGLELPPSPPPGGLYRPFLVSGDLAFLSGHGPYQSDATYITGKIGKDHDVEAGQQAAKQTGLSLLRTIQDHLGSIDRVAQVVKLTGFVNCVEGFTQQPQVINGCSELFREMFGEGIGVGTRSAVGCNGLPLDFTVEIEAIIKIQN